MAVSRMTYARKNIKSGVVLRLITPLTSFITRTALIYSLGNLYLGLNSLFTSVLQVLSLAELGFGSAMVFSMYKPIAEGDEVTVNALLRLYRKIYRIVGSVILGVGLLLIPFLPKLIKGELPEDVNIVALYVIRLVDTSLSYILFTYRNCLIDASQQKSVLLTIQSWTKICLCGIQVVILLLFRNYYVFCVAIPVIHVFQNTAYWVVSKKKYPQYKCDGCLPDETKKDISKRVTGLFLFRVSHVFRNSFDSIILSAFLGLEVLAKYQNYYLIITTLVGITSILTDGTLSSIGNSVAIETKKKNYNDFCSFQMLFMGVVIMISACMCCVIQPFIRFWVREENLLSTGLMILFVIYFFTDRMGNICYQYRHAAGLWWEDRIRPLVDGVTNLTLNFFLVQTIGIAGVMLSTILCHIFLDTFWGSAMLFRHYFTEEKQSNYVVRLFLYAIMATISCGLSMLVCHYIPSSGSNRLTSLVYMAFRGVVALSISGASLLLFCRLLPEYKNAMKVVKRLLVRHK